VWNINELIDGNETKHISISKNKVNEVINSLQINGQYIYTTGRDSTISTWSINESHNICKIELVSTSKNKITGWINVLKIKDHQL